MSIPTLTVVCGPPGAGKTTLAHALVARVGGPAICRDEIKEGMVAALGDPALTPSDHDRLNRNVWSTFFDLLQTLVRAGVNSVAEAAFQDRLWRPGLEPLIPSAQILLIRCRVGDQAARARQEHRLRTDPRRMAHADRTHLNGGGTAAGRTTAGPGTFDWPRLDVPTLDLRTDTDLSTETDIAASFVLTTRGTDA
jgi:predicted kinase